MMHCPPFPCWYFLHLYLSNPNVLTPFFTSILILVLLIVTGRMLVYGSQLHVGPLSPSHTSGAGSGTEHPEGPNFPQLPSPSLLSSFLCLLAFQEDASQVLGNLYAALLPSSTYTHPFSSCLHFHMSAPNFSLFDWLCSTFTLHVFVPSIYFPHLPYRNHWNWLHVVGVYAWCADLSTSISLQIQNVAVMKNQIQDSHT